MDEEIVADVRGLNHWFGRDGMKRRALVAVSLSV